MKILLINPPAKNFYNQLGLNLMPLGVGYLAAMLERDGHSVSVIDLQTEPEREADIAFRNFDLIGISSDTPRFNSAIELGVRARKEGIPVVMGGYHTTFLDEEAFEKGATDYVIRGEGEYSVTHLVEVLEKGGDRASVKGLTYRPNGKIKRNKPADLIHNLDELPFPRRDIFPAGKYLSTFDQRRMATMITSRGCPYDCYFCAASRFAGRKWRTRSLDSVFRELEQLMTQGYSSFIFVDDNFTLNYRRTMDFCNEVISRNWDIRWWCFSRVDSLVKHPDMVKKMVEAGNRSQFLGLESGNQDTLNHFQKRTTLEQQQQAVSLLKQYNISVFGSFILGELHETKKMIKKTIRYAKRLNPDTCQFSLLTPYPGSRLFKQMENLKQLITRNWDYYDGAHLVFKNPNLSVKSLQKLLRRAYMSFYIRISNLPGVIRKLFGQPGEIRELWQRIRSGFSIFHDLIRSKI